MQWPRRALAASLLGLVLGCATGDPISSTGPGSGGGDASSGAAMGGDSSGALVGGAGGGSEEETSTTSAPTTITTTTTTTSGGMCNDPSDCPPTGTPCSVPVCSVGACTTYSAPLGTACSDNGGTLCNGSGSCVPASCTDGIVNGGETGIDCGGPTCPACPDGSACGQPADCQSQACVSNSCAACGGTGQPCCPNEQCDASPNTCAHNTFTLWGGTSLECNCGMLRPGQELLVDEGRYSCDGRFYLVMQGDGNLVLYYVGVAALWSSNTTGTGANRAVMQSDGNFVVYDAGGTAWWASGTSGASDWYVAVQTDGNLVVYDGIGQAHWASDTCCY